MKQSLSLKVLVTILMIIVVGIGAVVGYFLSAQNRTLIYERQGRADQQAEVLYRSIKNNMLVGAANIARSLLQDLKNVETIEEIVLFRPSGKEAFSDNETIDLINAWMGEVHFQPSPEQSSFLVDESAEFQAVVVAQARQVNTLVTDEGRKLVYYVPLTNDPDCQSCHDPALPNSNLRGVIRVTTSLADADQQLQTNTATSIGIWLVIVAVLTVALTGSLNRLVLTPLKVMGDVVNAVAQGNLAVEAPVRSQDEIGTLAQQINHMIVGLEERLRLSKFVSRATLEEITSGVELAPGGEQHERTVLFSDIRGFTAFAEQHPPETVMEILNLYMQRQARLILDAGGDVDQFVGDEILGVFRSATQAADAVRAGLAILAAIEALNTAQALTIGVGIGIHTGLMIEGKLGAAERLQRTVIGDAVNLGSRLCGLAGPGELLISQEVYRQIHEQIVVGEARTLRVKGKQHSVTAYPVLKFMG